MDELAGVSTAGLVAVAAGAVASVSGFGIGSLLTPVLLLSFPAHQAVALVAVPHALASTMRVLRLRRDVDWTTFVQFGIASAAGGLSGALLQSRLGGPVLTRLLGLLLLLAGGAELAGRRVPLPRTPAWRLAGGAASGVFGGLVGNQGGLRSAALLGFALSPRQLVATATASAVIVDLARLPVYLAREGPLFHTSVAWLVAMCAGVTVGTMAGVPILGRVPDATFRRMIGALLVLLGSSLILAAA